MANNKVTLDAFDTFLDIIRSASPEITFTTPASNSDWITINNDLGTATTTVSYTYDDTQASSFVAETAWWAGSLGPVRNNKKKRLHNHE